MKNELFYHRLFQIILRIFRNNQKKKIFLFPTTVTSKFKPYPSPRMLSRTPRCLGLWWTCLCLLLWISPSTPFLSQKDFWPNLIITSSNVLYRRIIIQQFTIKPINLLSLQFIFENLSFSFVKKHYFCHTISQLTFYHSSFRLTRCENHASNSKGKFLIDE